MQDAGLDELRFHPPDETWPEPDKWPAYTKLWLEAKRMEDVGAALIDFRHSGLEAGSEAVAAVSIPVLGGLGGGPWLDGRVRAVYKLLAGALAAYADDVRAGRPVEGD